jgi:hypothetical protein
VARGDSRGELDGELRFSFPPESTFGKLGMLAHGTVLANAQNKHSAPGICTQSGLSLLRLFRHTGDTSDTWIMDLLRDIAHTLPQYMSRADRPIPWTMPYNLPEDPSEKKLRPGWMCERVNLTYWGGHEHPGEVFYYSCWSEVSLLLTIAELPGIYARMPAEVAARPADGSEFPYHDWVALEGALGGRPATLAVLNDSTYSYAASGGVLRFTLVRGVPYAEHPPFEYKDARNVHFLDQGWQERRIGLVAIEGAWTAAPLDRLAQEFQIPAIAFLDSAHPGDLPRESAGISVEPASVAVLAIRPC